MEIKSGIRLLRGSPNTLIAGRYVVDPGQPEERAGEIASLAGRNPVVLLTHFHADHLTAIPSGAEVYAPWGEELFVASVRARLFFTHGVYMEGAVYKGSDVQIAGVVKPGDKIGPFEVVSLPGHTFGHVGYYADGVLYAGDALFGDRVIERYGVPYLMDVDLFLSSLDRIIELSPEVLVIGHGPVAGSKKRILELVEANKAAVERALRLVEAAVPGDITSITIKVLKEAGGERGWENILLTMTTVRAVLSKLSREGLIYMDENGLWWRKS